MKEPKIHHGTNEPWATACDVYNGYRRARATMNPEEVTCSKCKQLLNRKGRTPHKVLIRYIVKRLNKMNYYKKNLAHILSLGEKVLMSEGFEPLLKEYWGDRYFPGIYARGWLVPLGEIVNHPGITPEIIAEGWACWEIQKVMEA